MQRYLEEFFEEWKVKKYKYNNLSDKLQFVKKLEHLQ